MGMTALKQKLIDYYNKHERMLNVLFFLGGILFDVATLAEIDSLMSIIQQVFYLVSIGALLYYDFLARYNAFSIASERINKWWIYRDPAIHFLMGGMLNIYSLFFLKSASFMASFVFIGFMLSLIIANELKVVKENKINLKLALYFICVFSFFAVLYPLILGFVGWIPFTMSFISTAIFIYGVYKLVAKKISDRKILGRALLLPGITIINLFLLFYAMGWIPPVPISVKEIGVYHRVEKTDMGAYLLSFEKPWWKFWSSGDQDFVAQAEDAVYIFVRIFSPARFNDSVTLHWQLFNEKRGTWMTTDKIKMQISGGRKEGYRGYAYKQNYQEGTWRVLVETNDGHEIGRQKFWVSLSRDEVTEERRFETEVR